MKATARILLLGICLLGPLAIGRADEAVAANDTPAAPVTDPAQVRSHFQEVVQRPEFEEIEENDPNARFADWISQWFTRLGAKFGQFKYANDLPVLTSLLMTLLVVLTVIGLVYIAVRLTRSGGDLNLLESAEPPGPKTFRPPEFYEDEIRLAILARDWHAAWLATWRQFLSRLENRQLVEADRTRTNRDYLAQLTDRSLPASALAVLTRIVDAYDRFIYGHQSIGETDWNQFHQQVNEAALLLNLDERRHPATTQREDRMNQNAIYIRVLLVVVSIVVLFSFLNRSPRHAVHDPWLPSSFNPVGAGNMALFQTLHDLDWPVERWARSAQPTLPERHRQRSPHHPLARRLARRLHRAGDRPA